MGHDTPSGEDDMSALKGQRRSGMAAPFVPID
jgi:hypothetical protein